MTALRFQTGGRHQTSPGLRETFTKRSIELERTNKAEIRPEEQWESRELPGEFMERNTTEGAKTHKRLKERFLIRRNRTKHAHFRCNHLFRATYNKRHKNQIKRCGQAQLVYIKDINCNIYTRWRWARRDTHLYRFLANWTCRQCHWECVPSLPGVVHFSPLT